MNSPTLVGLTGPTGPASLFGLTGPQGPAGPTGTVGSTHIGFTGITGPQGPAGPACPIHIGFTGPTGFTDLVGTTAGSVSAQKPIVTLRVPARRGPPVTHDWSAIRRFDADFCRAYHSAKGRTPTWKQRRTALRKKIRSRVPHLKTMQEHLPEARSLKARPN
jgi:hypothetical protein